MLKQSRHSELQSYFNYVFEASKRLKHLSSTYVKSDILSSQNPTRKAARRDLHNSGLSMKKGFSLVNTD